MCTRLPSVSVGLDGRTCCTKSELLIPLLCFSRWDKSLALTTQFSAVSTCSSPSGESVQAREPEVPQGFRLHNFESVLTV